MIERASPFQFHLGALFASMSAAAIAFAILRASGRDGLWGALEIGGLLFPVIEFCYLFWRNLTEKPYRPTEETADAGD